jgi:N-formylglutamate amidohydrolase
VHALQIEINRGLYMDETALSRKAYLTELSARMADLVARIAATDLNGEFSVSTARRRD